eukprot:TRINITY_DN4823_c0_g1_i1.p1 TRINITY_DN4823_c0_g1~~TRINITY_DN4823_c0_g1_i1.p1  ORF type:complete len:408 (+),score=93.26 TRINITY_DN4823_c0_g1_i1:175-1398(+)
MGNHLCADSEDKHVSDGVWQPPHVPPLKLCAAPLDPGHVWPPSSDAVKLKVLAKAKHGGHNPDGGHHSAVLAVRFHPTELSLMASGGEDSRVMLWDLSTFRRLSSVMLGSGGGSLVSLDFHPTDSTLVAAQLSDSEDRSPVCVRKMHVKLCEDGSRALEAAQDVDLGSEGGHRRDICYVRYSADGALLATASFDKSCILWAAHSFARLAVMPHACQLRGCEFAPDSSVVACCGDNNTLSVWGARGEQQGVLLHALGERVADERVMAVSFSVAHDVLASGGSDGEIKLWQYRTGELLQCVSVGTGVLSLDFDAVRGDHLVVVGDDRVLHLYACAQPGGGWRAPARRVASLAGHSEQVDGVDFSPGPMDLIVSCSHDRSICVWDCNQAIKEHQSQYESDSDSSPRCACN